ncbi:hypothetical protein [Sphingomonas sp. PB2P12]|uniref:hypothetical protein n=1 Tax=Sphingomonas sandaracina TaxID=3096157 RepID=UPI002FCA7B5C
MVGIGQNWNGKVYGTNTGNVSLALEGEDNALTGIIRLSDDKFGVVVYRVSGKFEAGKIELAGEPEGDVAEGMQVGEVKIAGGLTTEGRLDGSWETTIGTGGTFQLWPHNYQEKTSGVEIPEQLNSATRSLGAIRLYPDDVRNLMAQLCKDFSNKRLIVTYSEGGNEKNVYSDDFTKILDSISELRYLKISVQEPEMYGINRLAMIELDAKGENIIRVQSVQESWSIGKAEAVARFAQGYQRRLATQFRKFGLTANIVLNLFTLAALPGLTGFGRRLAFASAMIAVQATITVMHQRYIPNFVLFSANKRPTLFGSIGPGLLSWIITISGAVVGAIVYGLLKGELTGSPLMKALAIFY